MALPQPSSYSVRAPGPEQGSYLSNIFSPRLIATGGNGALNTADGGNSTPVITEIYMAELWVPAQISVTGIAVFAGSVWSDNFKAGLYEANGVLLAATASTAGSTTADVYQRAPFATNGANATFSALTLTRGTYYIGLILDGTTSRYNTHVVGNFGAGKLTSHVYATAMNTTGLTVTPPTTFTTALGPIASLY